MNPFPRRNPDRTAQAQEARRKAEEALAAERRRLEAMEAETQGYADLGHRLRIRRERNHISEHLTALYLGGRP